MIVLGIDPGTAITGWGVINKKGHQQWETIAYGAIRTDKDTPFPERLKIIFRGLSKVIDDFHPEEVAVEQLFSGKNKKNTILVSHARGAAILAAAEASLVVAEYSALQVKQSVVGYGKAEKRQVQKMVKAFLKLAEVPKPDDVADALAVAICHLNSIKIARIQSR